MVPAEEFASVQSANQPHLALNCSIVSPVSLSGLPGGKSLTDDRRHIPCKFDASVSVLYRVDLRWEAHLGATACVDSMNAGGDDTLQNIE